MQRSPVDKLARVGRTVLLVGTVLALFTLGAWTLRPEWIEDWDLSLVTAHVDGPTGRILEAENIRGADPAGSIELSEALLEDLGEVEPWDRLDPVVRRTLQNVVLNHRRLDQLDDALEACEEWVDFDPNNLRARAELGELLAEHPERREEGLTAIRELFELAPQVGYIAGPWVAALAAEGRYAEAMDAALESDRLALANSWTVSWMDGRPKKTTRRARLTPLRHGADGVRLEFSLQGPVDSMRVEPPFGAPLTLIDPVLEIRGNRRPLDLVFAETDVGLTRVVQSGNTFTQMDGGGAFFQVPLPHTLKASTVEFVFSARIVRNPAPALNVLAFHSDYELILAALESAGRTEQVRTLADARRRRLFTQKLQVYWKKEGSFSGQRSNSVALGGMFEAGRLQFETTLPVNAPATHLRIDFPEGVGTTFGIERIVTNVGPKREDVEVALEGLELTVLRNLERVGNAFTVTGADPHFGFELPDKRGKVHSATVKGWAQ
jgi:tetratricopeptide (TPR) repeat protein